MAESQGNPEVKTRLDPSTPVGQAWQEHAADYEHDAEAVRAALREGLLDEDGSGGETSFSWKLATALVGGLAATAVVLLVIQAAVFFDAIVAGGLFGLALLVVGAILLAGGNR